MSVPIEEQRFAAYLNRPESQGSIAHLPTGQYSFFIGMPARLRQLPHSYKIMLPFHWPDPRRIREVAIYIAWMELRLWGYTPRDLLVRPQALAHTEFATVQEVADRLIAPRPWVEAALRHARPTHEQVAQAARSLSIPTASVRAVLAAPSSPVADAVHRRIKDATGYPWFLPPELLMQFSADRW
jgi:hypothetical protein